MIRVLIVEDDPVVARVNAAVVGKTPRFTTVGIAGDGATALRMLRESRPDLMLLDMHLPDVNGLDILQVIRTTGIDVDVIAVTASREIEAIRSSMRAGVFHYLIKPYDDRDLRARLEHFRLVKERQAATDEAEQKDVDRMFSLPESGAVIPKGLSPETLGRVRSMLEQAENGLSASQAAEEIGVTRVSARRYLEHLAKVGVVDVELRYGSVGRPERRYAKARKRPSGP